MLTKTLDPNTRREIEEAALAANARISKRQGPYEAAIIANATWHILTVAPNCDRIAAGHLIGRRFGIYLPETNGPRAGTREPLLPGYLLVFVWGIADHAKRILDCPGVIDFLQRDGEIVVVQDEIVDDIREIENRERPSVLAATAIAAAGGASRKKKKRWRRGRKSKVVQDNGDEVVAVYPYSPILASMEGLDAAARISAFFSALGLGGRPE
jgi:transcription antitermination factor NusG